jgi:hypothetical protein
MVSLDISLDTVVSVLGIVIPLIGSIIWLSRKLDKIETNTEPIRTINETMIRLDERTMALALSGKLPGTVAVTLKNLGTVTVSAQPATTPQVTRYNLQFKKPFKFAVIGVVGRATGLDVKEHEMFGKPATSMSVSPEQVIITVPSVDPKLCSEYISFFLKWLDSEYFARANDTIGQYENIKV